MRGSAARQFPKGNLRWCQESKNQFEENVGRVNVVNLRFFWQSLRTHLVWKRWPILAMMDGFNSKNLKAHGPTWFYIIAIFSLQNQECRIIIIRTIFLTLPRFDASSISFKGHGARDPKNPRDPSWGILRANRRLPLLLRSQRFGHHDCIGALRQWVGHGRTVGATAKS